MASNKCTPYTYCLDCHKRAFFSEGDAQKSLGRAITRRNRAADATGLGTRRGLDRENRAYECPRQPGLYHLTGESRRHYELRVA